MEREPSTLRSIILQKHIWLTMKDNESTTDSQGLYYPDVMTFPVNRFKWNSTPEVVTLTQNQIDRMDIFMYDYYGVSQYDDIILHLNNIEFKEDLTAGDKLLMPNKEDLEDFFLTYII